MHALVLSLALLAVEVAAADLNTASAATLNGRAATYADLLHGFSADAAPPRHASAANYAKTTFDSSRFPLAKCLDSGPGAVYVRPATSPSGAQKFKIFFQGGGWCTSDEDCFARSKTDLGSTSALPATALDPAGYCGSAFLSDDPAVNPANSDWVSVYVPYCDGSSWTGSVAEPVVINATATVSYAGAYLRDALVGTLASVTALATATDVVIGGCSAGGLTIYLNIDYLAGAVRAVAPAAKVHALADAGFFLDHADAAGQPARTPLFQWGFDRWNASAALSPACLAANAGAEWRCIFAQYTARFIATPTFALNSRFDTCQLNGCELLLPDANVGWSKMQPSSRAAAVAYAADFDAALAASGFAAAPQHGGWISSCLVHCDAGDAAWHETLAPPRAGDGPPRTPSAAFAEWLAGGGTSWWSDRSATPNMTLTC